MKKLFVTMAVVALSALTSNAQVKEGYVLYDMKMEGVSAEEAAMFGDMETKIYFKNGVTLSETTSMMGSSQTLINDNGILMLQEQMGNKMAIKQTKEEMDKEAAKTKSPEPKIEYLADTKMIAGYECKKAIVTMAGKDKKEEKMEIWYNDKFENFNKEGKGRGQGGLKGLKGMPFEYNMSFGPMKMKMTVKEVSLEPVADSKFNLSTEGYKIMTMDELKAMQGGAGK